MKGWSQSKNNTQLWMWLVIEARSNAVRAILHRNLECQIHESRQIGSGQTGGGKSEHQHLGLSELKCTGMREFNSDDYNIYYCGKESLRRIGVAIMVDKSPKCSIWMQSQKWQNDLCSFPRQTIQYHANPCAPTSNATEAEVEWFYEDPQDLLELTPKKDVLFIMGDWNAKVGSQETLGVTGRFSLGV